MANNYEAMEPSAWTTGGGIAIGTDVDIGGIIVGAAATTLTLKHAAAGTATLLSYSGGPGIVFCPAIASTGPLNATSSGGSFMVLFRKRVV